MKFNKGISLFSSDGLFYGGLWVSDSEAVIVDIDENGKGWLSDPSAYGQLMNHARRKLDISR